MQKYLYRLLTLLCILPLTFLFACGLSRPAKGAIPSTSPAPSSSLKNVDWPNFTYFSSCYQNTEPFHAKNGEAVNDHVHFYVYTPTYGDLTNDGQVDAVVPYQCSAADSRGIHVFVYSGSSDHPRLLGDLPVDDLRETIANVTTIHISSNILHMEGDGYSANAPHCCPDLSIKTDYRWDGKTFVVVQSQINKHHP